MDKVTQPIQDIKPFDREQAWKRLTRKQRAFVQHLIDNPKASATQAYLESYPTNNRATARAEASTTLAKPSIQAVLAGFDVKAQETVGEMMLQRDDKRLAFDAARDVLDRIHGKATQVINQNSTTVSLSVSLSDITRGRVSDV